MAGDWIKVRLDLVDDPDVFHLADILSIDVRTTVGHLIAFWSWIDRHTADGKQLNLTENMVDRQVGVPNFALALRKVGWLSGKNMSLEIPNFDRHNGSTAKARALESEAKRLRRQARNEENKGVGQSSDKKGSESQTREEKRREDNNTPPIIPLGKKERKRKSASLLQKYDFSRWPSVPDESLFTDWIASKKRAKGSVSQRAINTVGDELTKACKMGFTIEDCLTVAEDRQWKGFKAEWMNGNAKPMESQSTPLMKDFPS